MYECLCFRNVFKLTSKKVASSTCSCPASVYCLMQVASPPPVGVGVTPAQLGIKIHDIATWLSRVQPRRKGVTWVAGLTPFLFLAGRAAQPDTPPGVLSMPHPPFAVPPRCGLGNVTLGCHSHPPCVCPGGGRPVPSTLHATPINTTNKQSVGMQDDLGAALQG